DKPTQLLANRGGKPWQGFKDAVAIGPDAQRAGAVLLANVDTDRDLDLLTITGGTVTLVANTPVSVTRLAFSGVTVRLGDGGGADLTISKGTGAFILLANSPGLTDGGVAGTFSGSASAVTSGGG